MPPRSDFRPIIPKRNPFPDIPTQQAKLFVILASIGHQGQSKLSQYPAAATSYRRTGELGRKWTMEGPKHRGATLLVRVGNNAGHSSIVQGPKKGSKQQGALFKSLGWPNVTDVSKEVWDRHKGAILAVLKGK